MTVEEQNVTEEKVNIRRESAMEDEAVSDNIRWTERDGDTPVHEWCAWKRTIPRFHFKCDERSTRRTHKGNS
ncbi:hypothetical protein VNO77_39526 [Canavalia gladiata]|uniref:Uncharacterized protein n=1 Tax=Canavalia gladiata TaxID=3824 RepID=A0AAN9KB83_CANGL